MRRYDNINLRIISIAQREEVEGTTRRLHIDYSMS